MKHIITALSILFAGAFYVSAFADDHDNDGLEPGEFFSDTSVYTCKTVFNCTVEVKRASGDKRRTRLWHDARIPDPANRDHNDVVEVVPVIGRFEEVERRHYEGGSRDVVRTHACLGGGSSCKAETTSSEPPYDRGVRAEKERMRYQHGYQRGYREVCLSLFAKRSTSADCLAEMPDLDEIHDPDS